MNRHPRRHHHPQPEGRDFGNLPKILSVFADGNDNSSIEQMIAPLRWTVLRAGGCRQARNILRKEDVAVVLCDQVLPDGSWRDLLRDLADLATTPALIVASALADEALWAEVLNLGAYDLLSKPFREDEVLRTLSMAPRQSFAAVTS